jgi:hypothetical protein
MRHDDLQVPITRTEPHPTLGRHGVLLGFGMRILVDNRSHLLLWYVL